MTRDELVQKHIALARYGAERLKGKLPACVDIQDLISSAYLGLVMAAAKYDESRGVKFETFASMRIRGAMIDDLRRGDWVPRLIRQHTNQIERARDSLAFTLGREPEEEELAEYMRVPGPTLRRWLDESEVKTQLPIEGAYSDESEDHEAQRADLIEDRTTPHPSTPLEHADVRDIVERSLHGKERQIIQMYYWDHFTMIEIGSILGVSESRVCQVHRSAIERIRFSMADFEEVELCICCETRQRSRDVKIGVVLQMCDYCYGFKDKYWDGPPNKRDREENAMASKKSRGECSHCGQDRLIKAKKISLCARCYSDRKIRAAAQKKFGVSPLPGWSDSATALATVEKPNGGQVVELVPAPTPIPGIALRQAAMKAAVSDLCRVMAHQMVDEIFDQGGGE